jgi:curved DNA-binding protein CbpA
MRYVPDPYRALGVERGASDVEIKAAHRRLAKRYHPDRAGGDTERFLLVHEAYRILSDPVARREWDARHAPGPMRASERAAARPRAANGRWTKAEAGTASPPAGGPQAAATGRDPASRTYTWSASEVPWWEEGAARAAKRPPGRQRPTETSEDAPAAETHDFDVYNRSSGAAWSMAARAYFRRGERELPRRGSFHHQGAQPLTAARARTAVEQEERQRRAGAARAAAHGAPAPVYATPAAEAGVAHDAQTINEVRAAAREQELAARWPSLGQRLLYALLAWIPLAVLIGYGGAVATGCDRAAASCPSELAVGQALAMGISLIVLLALPRLAYAFAVAAAGLLLASLALVVTVWFTGLRPPLAPQLLSISTVVLLMVYLALASWVLSGSTRRPWATAKRRQPGAGR